MVFGIHKSFFLSFYFRKNRQAQRTSRKTAFTLTASVNRASIRRGGENINSTSKGFFSTNYSFLSILNLNLQRIPLHTKPQKSACYPTLARLCYPILCCSLLVCSVYTSLGCLLCFSVFLQVQLYQPSLNTTLATRLFYALDHPFSTPQYVSWRSSPTIFALVHVWVSVSIVSSRVSSSPQPSWNLLSRSSPLRSTRNFLSAKWPNVLSYHVPPK